MNMAETQQMSLHSLRGKLRLQYSLKRHTSWRVGGIADRVYIPADIDDWANFVSTVEADEPIYVFGLGSNLLIRDRGIRGTVILTHPTLNAMRVENAGNGRSLGSIYCEAGTASPKLARFASDHGFTGSEFLTGIPGTIGGALAMNAGCFGAETWNILDRVMVIDRSGGVFQRISKEYEIAYRSATLKKKAPLEWFAAAWFALPAGDRTQTKQMIRSLMQKRVETQPLDQPNAGSVFRNPPGEFAARLVEKCGFKGYAVGGAVVSEKHANFIVNTGSATAADIESLIDEIQAGVKQKCGVELEPEVQIVGEH